MAADLNTLILNTIKSESKSGLEIIEEIKTKTDGAIILKQPSLYSALRRLEAKGFVTSYWQDSELGGKRHYYQATKLGIDALNNKIKIQDAAEEFINTPERKSTPAYGDNDIFPNIRPQTVNTTFSENDFDDDEPDIDDKNTINYKTILGDFLTDDNTPNEDENKDEKIKPQPQPFVHQTKQKIEPEKKPKETYNFDYIKEFENIFKAEPIKTAETRTLSPTPRVSLNNDQYGEKDMALLESIAKKYNENFSKQEETPEEVEMNLVDKINQKKKYGTFGIQRNETKYLYINEMNFVSGLCIFFASMAIYLIIFMLYLFKGWMNAEKYIILGATFLCSIIIVLVNIFSYYKFPDNKINYNFRWGKSAIIRTVIFVLLFVFIIAVNLLVGMESLSALFLSTYLIRWFVPLILVFGIVLRVIINYILSKQPKFYTVHEKQNKKK